MARIIESPVPSPQLPRMSVFDYIFPPKIKGSRTAYYDKPDPKSIAFIDGRNGQQLTRGKLEESAKRLASGIKSLGMGPSSVACIFGVNSLDWIIALFGCQAAGVIVSPASYGYAPGELLHQLSDSTASIIFVQPELLPVLEKALALPNAPRFADQRIILLAPRASSRYKCIYDLFLTPLTPKRIPTGEEHGTAYLCYSSGTTGRAKGVETSHHNITSQVQALNEVYEPLTSTDVVLGILPFSHIYGLTVIVHQPLTQGVPVVVLPRFEEQSVLQAIQKFRVTWGLIVPPILLVLLHSKNVGKSLRTVRGFMSGAAPLGPDLTAAFERKFPHIKVTQGYGLTETSPVTHVMNLAASRGHAGQAGKLMPTFQARLIESGQDVKPGERGELWLRGPSVMKGYWRNTDATAATFAEGGWFKTGDVAVMDKDGYFSIVDRVKELIKYKGYQVPPAELEALLLTHPKVVDAAVIGIYSEEQATELPRAYVVLAPNVTDSEAFRAEISKFISDQVANQKRLRGGVVVLAAIPKSPSGKILRKDLRAMAKVQDERQAKL